jgi:hypothetical protein
MNEWPEIRETVTVDFNITSSKAAELLKNLKKKDKLDKLLGPKLEGLADYGIDIKNDKLVLEGTDQAPHDPAYEAPSEELVRQVTEAIQAVITNTSQNPPMFAICSRIAVVAYTAAASPPGS